jgi:hypothetical protein
VLATRYGLPVAYETSQNHKTANHIGYWLGKAPVWQTIQRKRTAGSASVYAYWLRDEDRQKSRSLCRVRGPADPTKPATVVELEERRHKDWLLPTTFHTLTLRYASGETIMLTTGHAAPLRWLPMPVIGCGLNSGGPSWDWSAGFMRWRQKGLGAEGGYGAGNADVIAKALGLQELERVQLIRTHIRR